MDTRLSILRESPFFAGLSDEDILTALNCLGAKIVSKPAGAFFLRVGDKTDELGVVLSGSVLVYQEDVWGRRNVMGKVRAGESFADPFAVVPGAVMNMSVVAEEDCEVLMLNAGRLLAVCPSACERHNRIVRNLASMLAGKVLHFNDKITHMSMRTTRDKLLSYLSAEAERQGSLEFDIPYNRQQLADFLCVERAGMSTELSKLQSDGLLETNRCHFVLHV